MSHPLANQVGGTHYLRWKVQPIEFFQRNRWDFAACNIMKYLLRYDQKHGREDLDKALHYVDLRETLGGEPKMNYFGWVLMHLTLWFGAANDNPVPMTIDEFVDANDIRNGDLTITLRRLEDWVNDPDSETPEALRRDIAWLRDDITGDD